MTLAPCVLYMLFDGPPDQLIPHFASELARRDANVSSLKSPLARLSLPYRIRDLPPKATRKALAAPRMGLTALPMVALQNLTHNGGNRIRLHGIGHKQGFTLVEGLRFPDDLNQTLLPVTRICTNANLRLFTFFAGTNRLRFAVQGPGSGLRIREIWQEDNRSTWTHHDRGTPHMIENSDTTLTQKEIQSMLARLSPELPPALEKRRFTKSWEFRPGLIGNSVTEIAWPGNKEAHLRGQGR